MEGKKPPSPRLSGLGGGERGESVREEGGREGVDSLPPDILNYEPDPVWCVLNLK